MARYTLMLAVLTGGHILSFIAHALGHRQYILAHNTTSCLSMLCISKAYQLIVNDMVLCTVVRPSDKAHTAI